MGSALASGQLIAVFTGAGSSPLVAVGAAVIDLAPAPVKEFAIGAFGTHDKAVLLSGMAVVLTALAILAGWLSRRGRAPGLVLIVVLGGVGVAAVLGRSDLGRLGPVAAVVSPLVGVAVFGWLHGLAARWIAARAAADPELAADPEIAADLAARPDRRRFLRASAGAAVGAGVVALGGQALADDGDVEAARDAVGPLVPAVPAPAIPRGADFAADGTPTYLTDNADFYRIDIALTVPRISTADWSLRIHGMVDREVRLSYADIRRRPLVARPITLTCVSNPVGGPYISTSEFIGVPLRDLLLAAGVRPGADQVLSTSVDGFTAGTPVDALLDPDRGALLAIGMNGQPLPLEHGFPARLVVPGLYGYVSATKWVVDLEVTTFAAKQAYWVPRGYAARAPIKTESRIDTPGPYALISAREVVVAGIAWAPTKGIVRVDVRIDGGPWQPAELSTEVSQNTWRMWRTRFPVGPGTHTVESRATDATGYTQTERRAGDAPDGATGLPSVFFTVR